MISVITLTMGREKYLMDLIDSIMMQNYDESRGFFEHIICFQGSEPSDDLEAFFEHISGVEYPLKTVMNETNEGIGFGLNKAKEHIHPDSTLVMKADDDCVLRSPDFFEHVYAVMNELQEAVISPYPVGLIGNPGGVLSNDRKVIYGEPLDTYYTLRRVNHVGGFARISPTKLFKDFDFPYDKSDTASGWEDGHFARAMVAQGIPIYYLENALIVEHNESTLGQHARYGEAYFGKQKI
jgi:GT2 family glycosyltransferase